MSKVTCKYCQKSWTNLAEYLRSTNCGDARCPIIETRNQSVKEEEVRKPPHIKPVAVVSDKPHQVKIQTHYKEVDVESTYDDKESCLEVQVPKIIVINILKMGK